MPDEPLPDARARADAIINLAEAMEDISNRVGALTDVLRDARKATHDDLASLRRLTMLILGGLAGLTLLAVIAGFSLYLVNDTVSPDGSRYKQATKRTEQLVGNLNYDADCRHRRAMMGLPAPDLGVPCAKVTPADVFPGATVPPTPAPTPAPTPFPSGPSGWPAPVTPIPDGTSQSE